MLDGKGIFHLTGASRAPAQPQAPPHQQSMVARGGTRDQHPRDLASCPPLLISVRDDLRVNNIVSPSSRESIAAPPQPSPLAQMTYRSGRAASARGHRWPVWHQLSGLGDGRGPTLLLPGRVECPRLGSFPPPHAPWLWEGKAGQCSGHAAAGQRLRTPGEECSSL